MDEFPAIKRLARKILLLTLLILGAVLIIMIITSLGTFFTPQYRIINRLTSPDQKVDAVLVETNGGATTSNGYHVYIVPQGSGFKKGQELFIADHIEKLEIKWLQERLLQISFEQGRVFHYTNFWQSKEVDNFSYVVEVQLRPTTDGFTLSERDR